MVVQICRHGVIRLAKPFARGFYDSPAWRKCRKGYISKRQSIDGGMCEHCQREIGYIVDLYAFGGVWAVVYR